MKTIFCCEICGFSSENRDEVVACEAVPADLSWLPPVGSLIRLDRSGDSYGDGEGLYRVVEHGVGEGHRPELRTEPPCGDPDWGRGRDWWAGGWSLPTMGELDKAQRPR